MLHLVTSDGRKVCSGRNTTKDTHSTAGTKAQHLNTVPLREWVRTCVCTSKMNYHPGASLSEHAFADLMFCHGTQTMDNSRICHCLLFHEHGKQNFVQPFLRSRKLLRLHTRLD